MTKTYAGLSINYHFNELKHSKKCNNESNPAARARNGTYGMHNGVVAA